MVRSRCLPSSVDQIDIGLQLMVGWILSWHGFIAQLIDDVSWDPDAVTNLKEMV